MDESVKASSVATADPMAYNVEAIAKLEEKELHRRTSGEKVADFFVSFMGSMPFLVFHIVWFAAWFIINLNLIPGIAPFDPFPFGILTLIVSSEGVFLAIFILISQNRMARQSDKRAHLDLQVNILTEQEMTIAEHAFSIFIKKGGKKGNDTAIELFSDIFRPLSQVSETPVYGTTKLE